MFGLLCFNCLFLYIYRIIVYYYLGRLNVFGKWLMKGYIFFVVKIGYLMILRDFMGDWKVDELRKVIVLWFIGKEMCVCIFK